MLKKLLLIMLLFQTILSSAQVKTAKNINYAGNA
ncbi:MAG: alpha/beta hydrolase, partial [Brevundimonas sp.]